MLTPNRRSLKFILPRARRAVGEREFGKSLCVKVADKFKQAYWRLAQKMEQEVGDCLYSLLYMLMACTVYGFGTWRQVQTCELRDWSTRLLTVRLSDCTVTGVCCTVLNVIHVREHLTVEWFPETGIKFITLIICTGNMFSFSKLKREVLMWNWWFLLKSRIYRYWNIMCFLWINDDIASTIIIKLKWIFIVLKLTPLTGSVTRKGTVVFPNTSRNWTATGNSLTQATHKVRYLS